MQHATVALTILAGLTLTACGGSGSNNQTDTPDNPANPEQPMVDKAIHNFNQNALTHGNKVPNSAKRAPSNLSGYQANSDNSLSTFNSISIDGKNYVLATKDSNQAHYNYHGSTSYNAVSSGKFLSYSRFAVLNLKDYVSDAFLAFGQDTLAKDMPAAGKAAYYGYGLHQHKDNVKLIATEVDANIDFTAKTAAIGIRGDSLNLELQGNINGNKVTGDNNLNAAFYGPNAKELAGQYAKDGNGVFGVVKN